MSGRFEIFMDKANEYRFRLKAGNGEIILASEGYKDRASCDNGVESVRTNAPVPERFDKKMTDGGKFRFNLKAGNHQVIGTSQSYESAASRDNGIASVGQNAPEASVELNL